MKKAIIYYFTGTGNTRMAAMYIQSFLIKNDYQTTLFEIRLPLPSLPDPNEYDVSGFGYPVHAFNPPLLFLQTIKRLPKLIASKPAFIFKTAGEPFFLNNASSWSVMLSLRKKGFSILMDRHLLMPYNIVYRYNDRLAKQMVIHTRLMAKVIVHNVIRNIQTKRIIYPWTWVVMLFMRIQWVGGRINGPLFHVKKNLCIQCGTCGRVCPSNNVTFQKGFPTFGNNCSMCMGCTMNCPTDAIRPGLISFIRVNGPYPFEKFLQDDTIRDGFINEQTKGYYRTFRKYYAKTYTEINAVLADWNPPLPSADSLLVDEAFAYQQY